MEQQQLLAQWAAEAQQPFSGWDFSYLDGRYEEAAPPWSYDAEIRAWLPSADAVLDMGTGGGEKLLEFRDSLPAYTIVTEGYPPNRPIAQANLAPYGIQVVAYDSETDARMPFADGHFALIMNRHEAYSAAEIARVLRPNGVFCTQQVDGRDMQDLYSLFGVETAYPQVQLAQFERELTAAGLHIEKAYDWQGKAVFADVGALVYYLHAVPWEAPADFSVSRYQTQLLALHARERLEFTMRRFLLVARKQA